MKRKSEIILKDSPSDFISSIRFHETFNQCLLVSSWDCAVRLYDTKRNCMKYKWTTDDAVLDAIFLDPMHIAYGGTKNVLRIRDAISNIEETVGWHNDAIRKIQYIPKKNVIVSGSWDRTVKLWDLRQKGNVATYEQSDGKVFSMSVVEEKVAVSTSECRALIWDLRNMKTYLIRHHLNHQSDSIAISPNKQCYVIGFRDGRIAVEYINRDPEVRKNRYRFKCHRMHIRNSVYVYSVVALSFRNSSNIFASGGSNGFVNVWDGVKKKRLWQYPRYNMSITSLAYSHDGKKLAIASAEQVCLCRNHLYAPSATSIAVWNVDDQKIEAAD